MISDELHTLAEKVRTLEEKRRVDVNYVTAQLIVRAELLAAEAEDNNYDASYQRIRALCEGVKQYKAAMAIQGGGEGACGL